ADAQQVFALVPEHLVEGVIDVDATDVAVARQTEVVRPDLVLPGGADRRGPRQEVVLVELERRIVLVVVEAGLNGVAQLEKILTIQVGDEHLLLARFQAVQGAVSVLLQHVEVGQVIDIAVGLEVAEDAEAGLLIVEDEPAEIAIEGLDAGAHRNEIVGAAQILQLEFEKRLLQADVRIDSTGALADVDVDDSVFTDLQVVDVELGSETELP